MKNVNYAKLFDLTGKTAVVTGGVGILGKCFCSGLAEFGANVVVLDIVENSVSEFAKELTTTYGVKTLGVTCDTSSPSEVRNAVKLIVQKILHKYQIIKIMMKNKRYKNFKN